MRIAAKQTLFGESRVLGGVMAIVAAAVVTVGLMTSAWAVMPSSNEANEANGWAHYVADPTEEGVNLDFVSTRSFASCFEYRSDGDVSQKISDTNDNPDIEDGLYPSVCVNNETESITVEADEYVEVRMVFGAESDERFDWERINTLSDMTAPDVTITSPLDGATVHGDLTLEATISDNDELLRYYYFVKSSDGEYVVGPTKVSTSEAVVNFSEVVDTTEWADGEYVFQMEARDAATNKDAGSTAKVRFTVNNVVDVKDDCKQGGWEAFIRADGSSFKNQGQCVAYMVSSEKSKHHRD